MNPAVIGVFIPIVTVIGGIVMVLFLRYYENVERMAMIEKGMDPYRARPKSSTHISPSTTLRFALLAIGAGLGVLFGNILEKSVGLDEEVAFFSMILIFGGLGLLGSYLFELRMVKREKEAEKIA